MKANLLSIVSCTVMVISNCIVLINRSAKITVLGDGGLVILRVTIQVLHVLGVITIGSGEVRLGCFSAYHCILFK